MEFALQYEIQRSRPHYEGFMYDIYHQATEQVKLADRMGYHSVWTVEHHFLDEWSYSSAPEVWYGALSQVTSRIRLGHGVCLLPIPFNHPARVAERIAVLDIMSNGRVEFGSGRSITEAELDGFQVNPEDSKPMWEEAIKAIPKMWTQEKFSWDGKYFKMPERGVIPKPIQKPHPPMWVASTQPATWETAGHMGIGALGFGISEPGVLDKLIGMYKKALKDCEPVGSFVNDRTAAATVCICTDARGGDAVWQRCDRLHHPQGCGVVHAFRQPRSEGLRVLQEDGGAGSSAGRLPALTRATRQANREGRGDGRRPGGLPQGGEDVRVGRRRFAADAGAGGRGAARKGDADDRFDRQARDAQAQQERQGGAGRDDRRGPLSGVGGSSRDDVAGRTA